MEWPKAWQGALINNAVLLPNAINAVAIACECFLLWLSVMMMWLLYRSIQYLLIMFKQTRHNLNLLLSTRVYEVLDGVLPIGQLSIAWMHT